MEIYNIALFSIWLLISSCALKTKSTKPNHFRPNILFLAVDDLRPELGCYGKKNIHSPNIDHLASEGFIFKRAYCQQAVCGPSRASIMTGLRPDATGVTNNNVYFRDNVPNVVTLPEYFKQQGYYVEGMGKVYHECKGYTHYGDPQSWSVPYQFPKIPMMKWNKPENVAIVNKQKEANREMGMSDWNIYAKSRGPAYEWADVDDTAYHDGELAEMAIDALERLKGKDNPFFLALGFQKPHLPFCVPKKYWDIYNDDEIQLSDNISWPENSPSIARTDFGELRIYYGMPKQGNIPKNEAINLIHGYYASVSYVDAQIGKVLKALKDKGLADNTIIVLWGDHGWKLSEYSSWTKFTNYNIDINAPLIIKSPDMLTHGSKSNALVEFVDIYPSLCELAGLPLPKHLEGTSFVSVLKNPKIEWKKAAFSQFPHGKLMGYSMCTDRYHLIRWVNKGDREGNALFVELYDLKADPEETINVAKDPMYKQILRELETAYKAGWRAALQ